MSTFHQLPAISERVTLTTHGRCSEDAHQLTASQRIVNARFSRADQDAGSGHARAVGSSGLSVTELAQTITHRKRRLTRVPGIGKKTAERLLLELKGKWGLTLLDKTNAASAPLRT